MFYQLQSCTNLENLISKKEKVPSMAKNLSVTTSISDFDNYLSDLHGSCGSFRTKLYVSFFCCILFSYKFGILWPNLTQQSMDYNNLDCVNPEEEGVASSNEEDREEETRPKQEGGRRKEKTRCGVERDREENCHQHHDDADLRFTLGSMS